MITEQTITEANKGATIQDVARAAGVSKAAVSIAFSGRGRISAQRREAILKVARELRFEVNPHAQRLSMGVCQNTVGLFSLGLDAGVGTFKIQNIQHLLSKQGYDVPLHAYGAWVAEEMANKAQLMRNLCQLRPQALVCCVAAMEPDLEQELGQYMRQGGHVVCADTNVEIDCDRVVFDRFNDTYQATKYLLEGGHRDLGFYLNGVDAPAGERREAFETALRDFGGRTRPEWLFNGLFENGGVEMAARFLSLKQRPTALCVVNDNAALAFMATVRQAGVRVPEDVSVIGHDNLPIAPFGVVPLTTMAQPIGIITEQVAEMVCSRLEGRYDGDPRLVTIQGSLVERESVLPFHG